ncbi:DUF485 domain-containing protein [Actinomycetospora endophytica]|uniref:DUF485 domain-containing protein n=1 Tax=Actinomycetospora endophytica TaxID=2291215 RepID=A0ABS8P4T8_9PSEU|nr:DUF485 domain-containing protein [Actinomycetospora endophytica]MCD2193270.1 DUF485 domain-containing protein [Actinomycetospora endophytica]
MSATDESSRGAAPPGSGPTPYEEMQRSPEFKALRSRWRRYIFTMSGLFLAWFLVYVLLADFAPDVVNTKLGDTNMTVGLLLGLLQFVSTFAIAVAYARYAEKNLDPTAAELRARVEEKL